MSRVVILLLAGVALAIISDEHLKPGGLVGSHGEVFVVEDHLFVRFSFEGVQDFPGMRNMLITKLQQIRASLKVLEQRAARSEQGLTQAVPLLATRLDRLSNTLSSSLKFIDRVGPAVHGRSKRGLFDFVGELGKVLFGQATTGDVDAMGRKHDDLLRMISSNRNIIQKEFNSYSALATSLRSLQENHNTLLREVTAISQAVITVNQLFTLSLMISQLESLTNDLKRHHDAWIEDIVNAAFNKVTSQLLPLEQLKEVLSFGTTHYSLIPIFAEKMAAYYYPLLESTVTTKYVLVSVPFKTKTQLFSLFRIVPFPVMVGGHLVKLDIDYEFVMVSTDGQLIEELSHDTIQKCKTGYKHLFVCPATLFSFKPPVHARCPLALVTPTLTSEEALKRCSFESVIRKKDAGTFHVHFLHSHYFYFFDETPVSLTCNRKTSTLIAKGAHSCPDNCHLTSQPVKTLPSLHHATFRANLTDVLPELANLSALTWPNVTIAIKSHRLDLVTLFNDSSIKSTVADVLPPVLQSEVVVPSLLMPIVLSLLAIVTVVVVTRLGCKRYKALVETTRVL